MAGLQEESLTQGQGDGLEFVVGRLVADGHLVAEAGCGDILLSYPIVGEVIGFALRWDGQEQGVLWISGDTVLYDGVRQVADRLQVDVALLHLGGVQFPVTGPVRYTLTAKDAVDLCRLIGPRTAVPGLYLCGAATHPGGSVIGVNGRNAAMAVLDDLKR